MTIKEILRRLNTLERKCCCPNGLPETTGIPEGEPTNNQNVMIDPVAGIIYYWDGDSWESHISSESASNGLTIESGDVVLGDDAAGTSEDGVLTSDRFINQDGFDITFVGETSAVGTELIIHPEGYIEHNNSPGATGKVIRIVNPLQQDQGNTKWYEATSTNVNAGSSRNNDVFVAGWNLGGGGGSVEAGKTALGISFENFYYPGTEQIVEAHLLYVDTAGIQYRPWSVALPVDNKDNWKFNFLHISSVGFFDPTNGGEYSTVTKVGTTGALFYLRGSLSGTGGSFEINNATKTLTIGNYLMGAGAKLDASTFENAYFDKVAIGTLSDPLMDLSVTGRMSVYSSNVTSGGDPIGGSIYLSDAIANQPFWFEITPGLSAVYSPDQGAASDLAFYCRIDAARTEIMRLTRNSRLGINTTVPDKALEVNSATGDNLRLTYNDSNGSAANYVDFLVSSSGDLTITPVGDTIISNLPTHADEAAAVVAGLATNTLYKTATGELRIKL